MYKHMVLWKLKSEVDGVVKRDLALEVKRRLDALPSIRTRHHINDPRRNPRLHRQIDRF